ncbi:MAG: ferredoxin--NADP reductase [Gammaproteobacteria bacterium]|nr:MAG: ferredoxin--NADP reductase [Gammaproteobacteria bacterium]
MTWNTFPLVLEWISEITPTVRHFAFRRADQEPFQYIAGQFINLHWERDGKRTHRSYSVANPPGESEIVEIAMAPVEGGFATGKLLSLEPGDMVEASGPYGRFVLRDDPGCRYLLVATGTGVTPYRSMLPRLRDLLESGDYRVDLLLGVRGPDELLYGTEFREVAEEFENFNFHACYSRRPPESSSAWEVKGYVQARLADLGVDSETDIAYLCGNPGMVDEAAALLKEAGLGIKSIRREKYLSART